MTIQILFVVIFAVNLLLLWVAALKWYRLPGTFIFALLPLVTVIFDQPRFELDYFWWRVAGVVSIVLGLALLAWTKGKLWSEEFRTDGPYQFVRHPMYLGLIFVFVGW